MFIYASTEEFTPVNNAIPFYDIAFEHLPMCRRGFKLFENCFFRSLAFETIYIISSSGGKNYRCEQNFVPTTSNYDTEQ